MPFAKLKPATPKWQINFVSLWLYANLRWGSSECCTPTPTPTSAGGWAAAALQSHVACKLSATLVATNSTTQTPSSLSSSSSSSSSTQSQLSRLQPAADHSRPKHYAGLWQLKDLLSVCFTSVHRERNIDREYIERYSSITIELYLSVELREFHRNIALGYDSFTVYTFYLNNISNICPWNFLSI